MVSKCDNTHKPDKLDWKLNVFKVYHFKIQGKHSYFSRLFAEAKWWTNFILSNEDLKAFDTKQKLVPVKRGENLDTEPLNFLSSQMKQGVYQRLFDDIKGLAKKKRKGGKVGRLKFKSFVNSVPLKNQSFKLLGNRVKLQGFRKSFRVCGIKQLPELPDIRCGELIRKPSGIYLSVTVKVPDEPTEKYRYVGVDMGIKDAIVFNDGCTVNFESPVLEKRIKKAHKDISRKKLGSNNRRKARHVLRKLEEKLFNQKKDAVNKLMHRLKPHTIVYQDEMIKNWHKGLFAKQVQKSILGRFKEALKKDTSNLMVDRSLPTTQFCPNCSSLNKHSLNKRTYVCECGYTAPRDKHSANNMLVLSGMDDAIVESVLDIGCILSSIQSVHLAVKQESPSFSYGE